VNSVDGEWRSTVNQKCNHFSLCDFYQQFCRQFFKKTYCWVTNRYCHGRTGQLVAPAYNRHSLFPDKGLDN